MKSIFIIIVFFFAINILFSQSYPDNFEKYKLAFEYLKQSKEIKIEFKNSELNRPNCITLSDEIVYLGAEIFEDKIMNYEFFSLDSLQKIKARDSLIATWAGGYRSYHWQELNKLDTDNDCRIVAFFSNFYENRLFAEVVWRYEKTKDYSLSDWGSLFMDFLFYFKDDKIDKVFFQTLLH